MLGTAAVLAIYSAGYVRTRASAAALDDRDARRPAPPRPAAEPAPPVLSTPVSTAEEPPSFVAGTGRAVAAADEPPKPTEPAPAKAAVDAPASPASPVAAAAPAADAGIAAASVPAEPERPPAAEGPRYKDGSYAGSGTSRHGEIEATVVIEQGRIARAFISKCGTRWPCSWIDPLPPQVAQRQSAEVDYVTGATQSTNAFYFAVLQALGKAQ